MLDLASKAIKHTDHKGGTGQENKKRNMIINLL